MSLWYSGVPRQPLVVPQRQVYLFIVTVFLPCALLVALGARMLVQERELAQKRTSDHHDRMATAIEHTLVDRLERIRLQETNALAAYEQGRGNEQLANSATVFVATVDSSGPVLPWESDARAINTIHMLGERDFAAHIAAAAKLESIKDVRGAISMYRAVVAKATDPSQRAYAQLLLARALSTTAAGGTAAFAELLATPLTVRDEHGIPFAIYAAHALAGVPRAAPSVQHLVRRAEQQLLASRSISPAACYALLSLHDTERTRARCRELDDAVSVVRDARVLRLLLPVAANDSARWAAADGGRWVVSATRLPAAELALFIAVRTDSLATAMTGDARLATSGALAADARSLAPAIEGLSLAWPAASNVGPVLPLAFYASALFAALGIVLLGAYFLWRDVQREARLAHMRSQFVASVSHELKTPLTSVRIFAETLRDRSFIEPRVRLEYLDTIAREADRLTRLLDNVLEFSRVERGERRYHFSLQQLPAIVDRALVALRFPLEQQGFTVTVDCQDRFATTRCDPDAIEQAVLNLMSNAMKYSGGERRIDVAIARRGRELALSVRDYGMGIAPDHQPRIFDRFYRAPTVENSSISGTGLGLTLVQHIVLSHGGRIGLETAVGHGSTFTLFLPLPAASAESATVEIAGAALPTTA